MARRTSTEVRTEPPGLAVPRSKAEQLIKQQTERGRSLAQRGEELVTDDEYDHWLDVRKRWRKLTREVLRRIYTNEEGADEFMKASGPPSVNIITAGTVRDPAEELRKDIREVRGGVNCLISLRERLDLLPSPAEASGELGAPSAPPQETGQRQIFVVHGHNEETKEKVVRHLERTGDHGVTVLHEQPNEGRTLIEKFEEHASRSDYAVVLLTADDAGASVPVEGNLPAESLNPRARQNVIFELGYFVGALGRSRVAVLYEKNVELPSDYKGIAYIDLGEKSWPFELLRELKSAGLDYDLNKLA